MYTSGGLIVIHIRIVNTDCIISALRNILLYGFSLWKFCVCANRIIRRKARCGWNLTYFVWRNLQIDRQSPPTLLASNKSTIAPVLFPLWRYFFLNLNGIEYKDTSQRRRDSGWKQFPMTRLMHLTLIFRTQNGAVIVKDDLYKNDSP